MTSCCLRAVVLAHVLHGRDAADGPLEFRLVPCRYIVPEGAGGASDTEQQAPPPPLLPAAPAELEILDVEFFDEWDMVLTFRKPGAEGS